MRFIAVVVSLVVFAAGDSGPALGSTKPITNPDTVQVARGHTLYESRCEGCHSVDSNRVGPRHRGVVGRKAGKEAGYDYSAALKKAKFVWTPTKLDKWLQGPSKLVPGTKMFFTVSMPEDRAAIIAYLATQK